MGRHSDEDLLQAAWRDGRAFEEFYRRHVRKVVAFAARRCSTAAEIPDLVAAVWLEVIVSADRFDPRRGKAVPWLLGIAANLHASEARRRARQQEAARRLAGQRILDEDDLARLERRIEAWQLPPRSAGLSSASGRGASGHGTGGARRTDPDRSG